MLVFQLRQNLFRALVHLAWYTGQTRHMDSVTFVGGARHDLMHEDDLVLPLADRNVQVLDARERLFEIGQLVVVRGKQRAATDVVVQVFDNTPGDRNAVVGARTAADFVQNHQAAFGGVIKNPRRLGHLDHEGALAARQLVAGSDASKDAIRNPDRRLTGRYEAAGLSHQGNERHLPDISALARHIGTGDDQYQALVATGGRAVRHERAFRLGHVEHRVTAIHNVEHRLFDQPWSAVPALPGNLGQRREHVELRQHVGRRLQSSRFGRHQITQFNEQRILELLGALVSRENLLFVFLELRRDVTFGRFDRLFANILGRHFVSLGVRDLEVVAKHLVETDLDVRDARSFHLLRLILGDPLLAAGRQFAKLVQFLAKARANETAIAAGQRAIVHQRVLQSTANIRAEIEL